jgi:hypothetical protein
MPQHHGPAPTAAEVEAAVFSMLDQSPRLLGSLPELTYCISKHLGVPVRRDEVAVHRRAWAKDQQAHKENAVKDALEEVSKAVTPLSQPAAPEEAPMTEPKANPKRKGRGPDDLKRDHAVLEWVKKHPEADPFSSPNQLSIANDLKRKGIMKWAVISRVHTSLERLKRKGHLPARGAKKAPRAKVAARVVERPPRIDPNRDIVWDLLDEETGIILQLAERGLKVSVALPNGIKLEVSK